MERAKLTGNWTPEGKAARVALRRDYLERAEEFEEAELPDPLLVALKRKAGRPEDLADLKRLSEAHGEGP